MGLVLPLPPQEAQLGVPNLPIRQEQHQFQLQQLQLLHRQQKQQQLQPPAPPGAVFFVMQVDLVLASNSAEIGGSRAGAALGLKHLIWQA
jgi:hypothetical protein